MRLRRLIDTVLQQEDLNFALTNRIPRRLATRFMGWFSRLEHPLVRDLSMAAWRLCAGNLNLEEAKKARFTSLHDCFVRELKDGARPLDPSQDVLVSPCDAIVGARGRIRGGELLQAKGSRYTLEELLVDPRLAREYRDGSYVTLRLTSTMYHRFHAPDDCVIEHVRYVPGDLWNVNPIALKRVDRLFCRNERAIIRARLARTDQPLVLVAVGAILVAGIQLTFLAETLDSSSRNPRDFACRAAFKRGDEIGYFRHGSTIIVFATDELEICDGLRDGEEIRMGRPLLRNRSRSAFNRPANP